MGAEAINRQGANKQGANKQGANKQGAPARQAATRSGFGAKLSGAAIIAAAVGAAPLLAVPGGAAAQSGADGQLGLVASDPVLATQREADDLCGRRLIPDDNISFGDFTGDGIEDALILLDMDCAGSFSFCSPIGCSHRVWVGLEDGRFEYVNNIFASESRLTTFQGEPALQFDDGPIWAYNGVEFEPVGGGVGSIAQDDFEDDFENDDVRNDVLANDDFEDDFDDHTLDNVQPVDSSDARWGFDVFQRGVGFAGVTNRAGARISLSCRRGDFRSRGDFVMRFLPPEFRDEALPSGRGTGVLFDFVIDGRIADTRLLRRRRVGGPLVEASVEARGQLVQRIRAGSTLIVREASGRPFGRFMLRGSSRAIQNLISYCSQ